MLTREHQPRVMAQVQGCRAASGGRYEPDGTQIITSEGEDGPYPARRFQCVPLVDAICKNYDKANHAKPFHPDGTPKDQSWYLTCYNILNVPWTGDILYPTAAEDPEFLPHYSFDYLGQVGYRLSKQSPGALVNSHMLKYREQVVGSMLMIDGDLSDLYPKTDPRWMPYYQSSDPTVVEKLPWDRSPDLFEFFNKETLPRLRETLPWFSCCTSFYTTKNGWRWVAMLDRPIPVFGVPGCVEDLVLGLMISMAQNQIGVDSGCKDWTRHMRVPRCFKGDVPLGSLPYFRCSFNDVDTSTNECDEPPTELAGWSPDIFPRYSKMDFKGLLEDPSWDHIAKVLGKGRRASGDKAFSWNEHMLDVELGDMPSPEECQTLLQIEGRPTESVRTIDRVVKRLTGMDPSKSKAGFLVGPALRLWSLMFEGAPILEEFAIANGAAGLHFGNFYATKELCQILRDRIDNRSGITPQLIYALMVQPYLTAMHQRAQVDPSSSRSEEAVRAEAWRATCTHFMTQLALKKERQEEEAAEEERRLYEQLIADQQQDYARQLIWDYQRRIWGQTDDQVRETWYQRLLMITDNGVSVCQIRDGAVRWSDPAKDWATTCVHIRDAGHDLIRLEDVDENGNPHLRDRNMVLKEHATSIGGNFKCSRLTDSNWVELTYENRQPLFRFIQKLPGMAEGVEAVYHPCIEEYLTLIGGPLTGKLMDWLACFTRIDKPLPALYIKGRPGIGKGMITEGLKLLTARKKYAEFADALGNFQDHYIDTPYIVCDEDTGVPSASVFVKNVVGVLRKMIGGSFDHVNVKGVKGAEIEGEWRLFISANNADVFDIKQELTESDIEAMVGRVFYIDCDERTGRIKELIRQAGGRNGNQYGAGTETDQWTLRIAQHIKWMEQNRAIEYGSRFLIDVPESDWHESLRVNSSGGKIITQAIKAAIDKVAIAGNCEFCYVDQKKHRVLINLSAFALFVEDNFSKFKGNLGSVLSRLSHQSMVRYRTKDKTGRDCRPRCYNLDVRAVAMALYNSGYDVDFRHVFGDDMWNDLMPESIKREYRDDALQEPHPQSDGQVIQGPGSTYPLNVGTS